MYFLYVSFKRGTRNDILYLFQGFADKSWVRQGCCGFQEIQHPWSAIHWRIWGEWWALLPCFTQLGLRSSHSVSPLTNSRRHCLWRLLPTESKLDATNPPVTPHKGPVSGAWLFISGRRTNAGRCICQGTQVFIQTADCVKLLTPLFLAVVPQRTDPEWEPRQVPGVLHPDDNHPGHHQQQRARHWLQPGRRHCAEWNRWREYRIHRGQQGKNVDGDQRPLRHTIHLWGAQWKWNCPLLAWHLPKHSSQLYQYEIQTKIVWTDVVKSKDPKFPLVLSRRGRILQRELRPLTSAWLEESMFKLNSAFRFRSVIESSNLHLEPRTACSSLRRWVVTAGTWRPWAGWLEAQTPPTSLKRSLPSRICRWKYLGFASAKWYKFDLLSELGTFVWFCRVSVCRSEILSLFCQADVAHLAAKIEDGVKRGLVLRYLSPFTLVHSLKSVMILLVRSAHYLAWGCCRSWPSSVKTKLNVYWQQLVKSFLKFVSDRGIYFAGTRRRARTTRQSLFISCTQKKELVFSTAESMCLATCSKVCAVNLVHPSTFPRLFSTLRACAGHSRAKKRDFEPFLKFCEVELNCRGNCSCFGFSLSSGGRPSPFDRNMGTKMAAKCVEHLISQLTDAKQADGVCIHVLK